MNFSIYLFLIIFSHRKINNNIFTLWYNKLNINLVTDKSNYKFLFVCLYVFIHATIFYAYWKFLSYINIIWTINGILYCTINFACFKNGYKCYIEVSLLLFYIFFYKIKAYVTKLLCYEPKNNIVLLFFLFSSFFLLLNFFVNFLL